ncbi:hypothetical protein [Streptomyces sp. GC420]|uniref:hypothetical protein n=1 Tax=Streptomyces sp. GC420 TaxID=2697568 RepID=UPI001FB744A1|nr:hypothetical protein [Streptomyces sp. GC420]
MRDRTVESPDADEKGCLRWVLGVPLVILHLIAAFFCWTALITRPSHPWDDTARGAITLMSALAIAVGALALLITAAPSSRRALGPWWFAPPIVVCVVAAVRWALAG